MKQRLLLGLGLFVVLTAFSPRAAAKGDDCSALLANLEYYRGQLAASNADLAYAQLQVSWDIQGGRGPGDVLFDMHVRECEGFAQNADGWEQAIDDVMSHLPFCY